MRPAFIVFLAFAAQAQAQETAPVIVVTADRRGAPLERIGASIARLGGNELDRVEARHPAEALNRLPGVNIHRNNGVESLPALRSPVLTGGQAAGAFLVLDDGVPVRSPAFGNVNQVFETNLDFAAGVEVQRGPGSAFYGSNAVHGVFNVLTPEVADATVSAGLTVGEFGRIGGEALLPSAGGYAALAIERDGGFRDGASVDRQQALLAGAAQVAGWRADARLTVQNLNQETASFVQGFEAFRDARLAKSNPTPGAYRDQILARAAVKLSRTLDERWEARLTPYARWIDTDLNLSFLPSRAQEITRQKGGGLQAALYRTTPGLALTLGADVDLTRGEVITSQSIPTVGLSPATTLDDYPQGLQYDYTVDAGFFAGFADLRWDWSPRWRLDAGLRVETAVFDYDNRAPDGDFGRFRRAPDRRDQFTVVTPKLGLVRTLPGRGAVFARYARGARAPQATDLYSLQIRQRPGEQDAETIDSGELGWRGRHGGLAFELVGYAAEKRGSAFRAANGFTVTDANTRHRGVEASIDWDAASALTIAGWATYARHTYRFDSAADGIRRGATVDSAPEWLANLRALARPSPALDLEAEWAFVGPYFADEANARPYDGHSLVHLRGRYRLTPAISLTATLRNVEDRAYAERADFAFGQDRYFPGEPRSLSVGLRYAR